MDAAQCARMSAVGRPTVGIPDTEGTLRGDLQGHLLHEIALKNSFAQLEEGNHDVESYVLRPCKDLRTALRCRARWHPDLDTMMSSTALACIAYWQGRVARSNREARCFPCA